MAKDNSGKFENFVYVAVPEHLMEKVFGYLEDEDLGDTCSTTEEDSSTEWMPGDGDSGSDIEMADSFIEDNGDGIPNSDSYEPSEDDDNSS